LSACGGNSRRVKIPEARKQLANFSETGFIGGTPIKTIMAEFKFFCPNCGQHIQCDMGCIGSQISCPACKQTIDVPRLGGIPEGKPSVQVKSKTLIIISAAVLFALVAGTVLYLFLFSKSTPQLPGLVALWKAEGNARDSIGGNNGDLMNDAGFDRGVIGKAFSFNGNQEYVEVPGNPAISPTGPFAAMAWVKYSKLIGYRGGAVLAKGADAEAPVDWAMTVCDNHKLRPHANVGNSWVYFDCATTLKPGVWYHVALVYDGASLKGYVNGALDGTQPVSGALQATDNSLKIGSYAPVNGTMSKCFFAGEIDEVALFNRALSAAEIKTIYKAGAH